jgi:hypothetical protein
LLLQKRFGRENLNVRKRELAGGDVFHIASHDAFGISRDRKFYQVVVGLVLQVRSPLVVDANSFAMGAENVEQRSAHPPYLSRFRGDCAQR